MKISQYAELFCIGIMFDVNKVKTVNNADCKDKQKDKTSSEFVAQRHHNFRSFEKMFFMVSNFMWINN